MDQVSIILTALASGTAAGLKDSMSLVLKDSYNGLKMLLQHKFAGKPESEIALSLYTDDPLTYEKPLREALVEHDQAVVEAAQQLLALIQPQQSSIWKYNTQITGDDQRVDMHFGDRKD